MKITLYFICITFLLKDDANKCPGMLIRGNWLTKCRISEVIDEKTAFFSAFVTAVFQL